MYFLGLGIVLLLLKWQEFGPVAEWSWWTVLAPFALAVVWWTWADWSGHAMRKVVEREEERKLKRCDRRRAAMRTQPAAASNRQR